MYFDGSLSSAHDLKRFLGKNFNSCYDTEFEGHLVTFRNDGVLLEVGRGSFVIKKENIFYALSEKDFHKKFKLKFVRGEERECVYCKKTFRIMRSQFRNKAYCSQKCATRDSLKIYRKKKHKGVCLKCGKSFFKRAVNQKFCHNPCDYWSGK